MTEKRTGRGVRKVDPLLGELYEELPADQAKKLRQVASKKPPRRGPKPDLPLAELRPCFGTGNRMQNSSLGAQTGHVTRILNHELRVRDGAIGGYRIVNLFLGDGSARGNLQAYGSGDEWTLTWGADVLNADRYFATPPHDRPTVFLEAVGTALLEMVAELGADAAPIRAALDATRACGFDARLPAEWLAPTPFGADGSAVVLVLHVCATKREWAVEIRRPDLPPTLVPIPESALLVKNIPCSPQTGFATAAVERNVYRLKSSGGKTVFRLNLKPFLASARKLP